MTTSRVPLTASLRLVHLPRALPDHRGRAVRLPARDGVRGGATQRAMVDRREVYLHLHFYALIIGQPYPAIPVHTTNRG